MTSSSPPPPPSRPVPPATIVVASRKGGAGKTTIVACLASLWSAERVVVAVDADPQGSLAFWHRTSVRAGFGVPRRVLAEAPDELRLARARPSWPRDAVILIDTPGFGVRTVPVAMDMADLILVPVQPSMVDLAASGETLVLAQTINRVRVSRNAAPAVIAVVMSRTTPGTLATAHTRAELADRGWTVLTAELVDRAAYRNTAYRGATPTALEPRGKAAAEVRALGAELATLLRRASRGGRKQPSGRADG